MAQTSVRRRSAAAVAGLWVLSLALGWSLAAGAVEPAQAARKPKPTPTATPTPAPDFTVYIYLDPTYPYTGDLARDGVTWGPHHKMYSYGGCFFVTNIVRVRPLNGFTGTVDLAILDLPPGVTSQTPTSVTITDSDWKTIPLELIAAPEAPLGTATVSVRATSGSIVRSGTFKEFRIVDERPPCE